MGGGSSSAVLSLRPHNRDLVCGIRDRFKPIRSIHTVVLNAAVTISRCSKKRQRRDFSATFVRTSGEAMRREPAVVSQKREARSEERFPDPGQRIPDPDALHVSTISSPAPTSVATSSPRSPRSVHSTHSVTIGGPHCGRLKKRCGRKGTCLKRRTFSRCRIPAPRLLCV